MSLDIEGAELQFLRGLDFSRRRYLALAPRRPKSNTKPAAQAPKAVARFIRRCLEKPLFLPGQKYADVYVVGGGVWGVPVSPG